MYEWSFEVPPDAQPKSYGATYDAWGPQTYEATTPGFGAESMASTQPTPGPRQHRAPFEYDWSTERGAKTKTYDTWTEGSYEAASGPWLYRTTAFEDMPNPSPPTPSSTGKSKGFVGFMGDPEPSARDVEAAKGGPKASGFVGFMRESSKAWRQ